MAHGIADDGCAPGTVSNRAFTLVELLVSMAILSLIILVLVGITTQTGSIWRHTTAKVEQFREARAAYEAMTTRIGQATLNTYWDYDNPTTPTRFERRSELRFTCGQESVLLSPAVTGSAPSTHCVFFEAPFGVTSATASGTTGGLKFDGFENLLCTWGYYLNYGSDAGYRPSFLTPQITPNRYRYRLMELWQPSEQNQIYSHTSNGMAGIYNGTDWFTSPLGSTTPVQSHMLAENIIALVLTPRLSQEDENAIKGSTTGANADASPLAPAYSYDTSPITNPGDSRYSDARLDPLAQLPPIIQVTMVAIDENSAQRLNLTAGSSDPFSLAAKFQLSANYSTDLLDRPPSSTTENTASLESSLINAHINYRIFKTNVMIRGSKWSRSQTK